MTAATARSASTFDRILSLERLAALPSAALAELYRRGAVPDDLTELDGRPKGRVLAVRGAERGAPGRLVRAAAGHPAFPWDGKSFWSQAATEGRGTNRVVLFGRRFTCAPFATRVEPSALDGQPCVRIDYAATGNPWPVSRIRDELREVAPDLFLGPALWTRRDGWSAPRC